MKEKQTKPTEINKVDLARGRNNGKKVNGRRRAIAEKKLKERYAKRDL